MTFFKIITGSSASVPTIPNNSAALVVTSPPYAFAKAYRRSDPENIGNYEYQEYFDKMRPVYQECFRVLMTGRKCIVNITDIPDAAKTDGRFTYFPYGMKTVELLQEVGFELEEVVLWDKGRSRSGGTPGTLPFPPSPMLLACWEYNFIMRKPGETQVTPITEEEREASRMSTEFMRNSLYTVWNIPPETQISYHIAPYPLELPSRFIKLYTFVGETVYEPFLGSGTTMLAAKKLNRSCIGVELGYDTTDGMSWLEHIKRRVGWLDGNLAAKEISYEVVDPQGNKVTEVVEGLGKEALKDANTHGSVDEIINGPKASKETKIISRTEEKDVVMEKVPETATTYDPKSSWRKQKQLWE